MCLGVPGRITQVQDGSLLRLGTVDFGGVRREVCLSCVPDAGVGDYVIVHAGFAISQLDEDEAHATLELLRRMGDLERELGPEPARELGPEPARAPGPGSRRGPEPDATP